MNPEDQTDDPVLTRAIKRVSAAEASAKAAKQTIPQEDYEAVMRSETGGKYGAKDYFSAVAPSMHPGAIVPGAINTARAIAHGFSMNWDAPVLKKLFGEDVANEWQEKNARFAAGNPVESGLANVTGAYGLGRLLPLGGAATGAGAVLKAIGVGTGLNAVAGAGAAEPGHTLEGAASALSPANMMLSLAGAVPAALTGVGRGVTDFDRAALNRVGKVVKNEGGPATILARQKAAEQVGLGDEFTLGRSGPYARQAAEDAASNSNPVALARAASENTSLRSTPQRMMDFFKKTVGLKDINAPEQEAAHKLATKEWAHGKYTGLEQDNPTVANTVFPSKIPPEAEALKAEINSVKLAISANPSPKVQSMLAKMQERYEAMMPELNPQEAELQRYMRQPVVQDALSRAKTANMIGNVPEPVDQPSFTKMFQFKQDVQDAADIAIDKGGGKSNYGYKLKEVAQKLDEHLQNNVDTYGEVSAEYKRRMGLSRSFQTGHELYASSDASDLAKLKGMSADELHNARVAMAHDFVRDLRNPTMQGPLARRIIQSSLPKASENSLQDKLEAMFSNRTQFDNYMKMANITHDLGIEPVSENLASTGADAATTALRAAATPGYSGTSLMGPKNRLLRFATDRTVGIRDRGIANAMAPRLNASGPQIGDVLDELTRRRPLVGSNATQGVPAAVSGLLTRNQ